jgi:hypothetical protein
VTVAGETPTLKMGRRFWYSLYGDAVRQIAERYTPIAEDQGSSGPGVVLVDILPALLAPKALAEDGDSRPQLGYYGSRFV